MIEKILPLIGAAIFFMTATAFAETADEDLLGAEITKAVKSLEKKNLPLSFEARGADKNFKSEEYIFRYKNFSADWLPEKDYVKLTADNEIISLMGTGAYWTYGFSVEKKSVLPTAGIGIYMAIMAKMKIYVQFSGIYFGGKGRCHDFETGLKYSPNKNISWTAGYRSIGFNHGDDFKMSGPFIGLRSDF